MKSKSLLLSVLLITISQFSFSQTPAIIIDWSKYIGVEDSVFRVPVAKDSHGYIIEAGFTDNVSTGADILVVKYNTNGSVDWSRTYSSVGNYRDQATCLAVGTDDHIYVGGFIYNSAGNYDWEILQYDTAGTLVWHSELSGNANGYDVPASIAIGIGTVYACGVTNNTATLVDYTLAAFDKQDGSLRWSANYDYAHFYDIAFDLKYSAGSGTIPPRLEVVGGSQNSFSDWDYCTLGYDTNGNPIDTLRISGTSSSFDRAKAIINDGRGNFYVTGASSNATQGFNIKTVKINSGDTIEWIKEYNYQNADDEGNGIIADTSGNVYVCGQSFAAGTGSDYILIKYDVNGDTVWTMRYAKGYDDVANALCFDAYGNIIVTGSSMNGSGIYDIFTIAYDTDGDELWQDRFDGDNHLNDYGLGITADVLGNIYVTGQSQINPATYKQVTIKYRTDYFILPKDTVAAPSSMLFYPNNGQLIDSDDSLRTDIFYYTKNQYPQVFFHKDSISFVLAKLNKDTAATDTLERISMTIVSGGNLTKAPLQSNIHDTDNVLNYFLAQCPDGVTDVEGSEQLFYKDVYPKVDMIIANNNAGMKFYLVLKPGFDIGDMIFNFTGQQSLNLVNNSDLLIQGLLGSVTYERPRTYYIDSVGNKTPLPWLSSYSTNGSEMRIYLGGSYDNTQTLVLECARTPFASNCPPGNLNWCTYYGAPGGNDSFYDVQNDNNGYTYIAASAQEDGFPTTTGVLYQHYIDTHNWFDGIIVKFKPSGLIDRATYYGGTDLDEARSVTVDNATGNIYFCGYTWSTDFPNAYSGTAYHTNVGRIFIAEINSACNTKIWSTQFGGVQNARAFKIRIDHNNQLYVVGSGEAMASQIFSSGIYNNAVEPCTTGCTSPFIAKFKLTGERLWVSFIGNGFGGGGAEDITFDGQNHAIVIGNVDAAGIPLVNNRTGWTYNTNANNQWDGFISIFKGDNNTVLLSEYFSGSGSLDLARNVTVDNNNNIFVAGYSNTSDNSFELIDAGNPAYFDNVRGAKNFIAAFNSTFTPYWLTLFGSVQGEYYSDVYTDSNNDIYLAGYCINGEAANLPFPTPNLSGGYISTNGYGNDSFLAAFLPTLVPIWTTSFGGSGTSTGAGNDYISALSISGNQLYAVGSTTTVVDQFSGTDFPLCDGGGIPTFYNNNTGNVGFIARFNLNPVILYGIDELNSNESAFSIFPNPSTDVLNVHIYNKDFSSVLIQIYDVLGREIESKKVSPFIGSQNLNFTLNEFAAGTYVIKCLNESSTQALKFVKY